MKSERQAPRALILLSLWAAILWRAIIKVLFTQHVHLATSSQTLIRNRFQQWADPTIPTAESRITSCRTGNSHYALPRLGILQILTLHWGGETHHVKSPGHRLMHLKFMHAGVRTSAYLQRGMFGPGTPISISQAQALCRDFSIRVWASSPNIALTGNLWIFISRLRPSFPSAGNFIVAPTNVSSEPG